MLVYGASYKFACPENGLISELMNISLMLISTLGYLRLFLLLGESARKSYFGFRATVIKD